MIEFRINSIRKINQKGITYLLTVFFLVIPFFAYAAPAEFFYDAQGRLIAEKDDAGNMAVHRYDAVGNLLSIDNFSPTAGSIGLFLLLPDRAPVGTEVTIEGFGFRPRPSENTVTFNGTPAVVSSSTADSLTVTVLKAEAALS